MKQTCIKYIKKEIIVFDFIILRMNYTVCDVMTRWVFQFVVHAGDPLKNVL